MTTPDPINIADNMWTEQQAKIDKLTADLAEARKIADTWHTRYTAQKQAHEASEKAATDATKRAEEATEKLSKASADWSKWAKPMLIKEYGWVPFVKKVVEHIDAAFAARQENRNG